MTKKQEPTFRLGAVLTLVPITCGLLLFIWGASADYTGLKAEVKNKAEKSTVENMDNKIDSILIGLCIIDPKTCILKEEE